MASYALPTALFEGLLLKLVTVIELTQRPEGTVTPQAKQALLQAVRTQQGGFGTADEVRLHRPTNSKIR